MSKSEVNVILTLQSILNSNYLSAWTEFCEKYGYDPYCIANGADPNTRVTISLKDAEDWELFDKED